MWIKESKLSILFYILLYVLIDVWISFRQRHEKNILLLPLFVLSSFVIIALILGFFGDTFNPFTEEEALDLVVTDPENEKFPQKEGKNTENVNGYVIERETIVDEQKNQIFHITLKEKWKRGNDKGSWEVK